MGSPDEVAKAVLCRCLRRAWGCTPLGRCGRPLLPSMALVSSRARSAMIPLEEDPNTGKNQPHKCEQWKVQHRKYYNCNNCGSEIYFDDARKSKNGKYIPLDKATSQPHQCDE
jgi:hypothetical protein